jgi:hypothetical protein
LKVEPKFGKKGEILFAPVSKLAPGLVKGREMDERMRVLTEERNRQCMDVAYFYVRIFQIYAALALTVLDANPVRRSRSISYTSSAQKPGRAIFTGGALLLRPKSGERDILKEMLDTPFEPIVKITTLQKEFDAKSKTDGTPYLIFKSNKGTLVIDWFENPPTKKIKTLTTNGFYQPVVKGASRIEASIILDRDADNNIILLIDGNPVIEFFNDNYGWKFKCSSDSESIFTTEITQFKNCLDSYFEPKIQSSSFSSSSSSQPQRAIASSSYSSGSITAPSGKSVFTGFEDMKKVLEQRFTGKGYPKAYCIARAMTLLNPIFSSELLNPKQPLYTTQICSKVFDFEVGGLDAMPRLDRPPNANLYFKSLIALYYDDYKLNRDGTFSQSQTIPGKNNLMNASKLLAALYGLEDKEGKFIESSTRFTRLKVCDKEGYLAIKDMKLVNVLQKDVIMPMIQLQEEHTKKVNAFFKKMFDFRDGEFRFSGQLREGGNEAVRNLGKEAAALLLDYYLKSEAYYIKGSRIIEQNKNLLE